MPAGMEVSGSVDVRKLVPLPACVVHLHPGPGYPPCATPHQTTSHHHRVYQVDTAGLSEIRIYLVTIVTVTLTEVSYFVGYASGNAGVVVLELGESVSVVISAALRSPPMMMMPEGESQDTW